jgi:hypothetical protein
MVSPNLLTSEESLFNRFITSLKAVFLPTPGSEANSLTAFSRSLEGNSLKLMSDCFYKNNPIIALKKAGNFLGCILFAILVTLILIHVTGPDTLHFSDIYNYAFCGYMDNRT